MIRQNHLKEIDGLRALAVLAVLVYHYDKTVLAFGYLGVDIFFAISGYVITKSILESVLDGSFSINDFFLRRMKRLIPALAVVVIVTMLVGAMVLPTRAVIKTGAMALVGSSNIALWYAGQDYFALVTELNPLTHTWSLGVEEQFYLFFPFLLLLARKRLKLTCVLLLLLAVCSLVGYLMHWEQNRISVFYLTPFRLWELLGGALVFIVHRYWGGAKESPKHTYVKYGLLAFLFLVLSSRELPEHLATLLCVFTTIALLYFTSQSDQPNTFLVNKVSVYIGRISYSLYLWHWPIAVFGKLLLPESAVLPVYILLTAGMSHFSYRYVELPLRNCQWVWFQGRLLPLLSSYVGVVVMAVSIALFIRPKITLFPSEMRESQFMIGDPCHIPDQNGLTDCLQASQDDRNTVWLIGDSHAGNFSVSLRSSAETLNWNFQFLTGRSLFLSLANLCSDQLCPEGSFAELSNHLKKVYQPGDIVLISFARDRLLGKNKENAEFSKNFVSFVGDIDQPGLNIVLVEDIPKVCKDNLAYQRSAFYRDACTVSAADSRVDRLNLSAHYKEVVENHHLVTLADPHDLLCERNINGDIVCSNWLNDELLYLDASPHLTYRGSLLLASFFTKELKGIIEDSR